MRLWLIVLTFFYCCQSLSAAAAVEDDTVTINACSSCRSTRQAPAVFYPNAAREVLVPLEGTACDSLEKRRGKCQRVSDCYPLLFSDRRDELLATGLIDIFKHGTGVCEPDYIIPVAVANRQTRTIQGHRPPSAVHLQQQQQQWQRQQVQKPQQPGVPEELICCTSGQSKYPLPLPQPTQPFEKFVVGGQRVSDISKYPWMASLHIRGRHSCGGSLINRYTVLTAAHCVKDLRQTDVANLRIYLGHHDVKDVARGVFETRTAAQIKYHRGFSMRTLQDDIALIILDKPIENHAKISPVTYTELASSDAMSTVSGWGQTSWTSPTSPVLLEATMRVWSNVECQTKYVGFVAPVQISLKQVCAGSPGIDSCRGDSGGPLHVSRNGVMQQVGIVSFGGKCGEYPGVYTRVASYRDWIEKNQKQ